MGSTVAQDESANYDFTVLLDHYQRAQIILGQTEHRADRLSAGAEALCRFFSALLDDETFWAIAGRFTNDPPAEVSKLFTSLTEFESQEHDLLCSAGMSEWDAAGLAVALREALDAYDTGSLMAAERIRSTVQTITGEICDVGQDLKDRKRRRSRLRKLAFGLKVASEALATAANIAAPPPLNAASIVAGLSVMSKDCANYMQERS